MNLMREIISTLLIILMLSNYTTVYGEEINNEKELTEFINNAPAPVRNFSDNDLNEVYKAIDEGYVLIFFDESSFSVTIKVSSNEAIKYQFQEQSNYEKIKSYAQQKAKEKAERRAEIENKINKIVMSIILVFAFIIVRRVITTYILEE